jgi:hypothetical protein
VALVPPGQTWPQAPQLLGSLVGSTHVPPQQGNPPAEHGKPGVDAIPHAWFMQVAMVQGALGVGQPAAVLQRHTEFWHVVPPGQTWPQAPQLLGSLVGSTHVPPQQGTPPAEQGVPGAYAVPHWLLHVAIMQGALGVGQSAAVMQGTQSISPLGETDWHTHELGNVPASWHAEPAHAQVMASAPQGLGAQWYSDPRKKVAWTQISSAAHTRLLPQGVGPASSPASPPPPEPVQPTHAAAAVPVTTIATKIHRPSVRAGR